MQVVHRDLTKNSHLKHDGRLQYSLFLKGVGLSLEESLNFWKKKFAKKTPEDKFEKEYAYNFRHTYGQEGKRVDYPPYNCIKIQNMKIPSQGETHGCPFKLFSEDNLRKLLNEQGLSSLDIEKIVDKKKNHEFSVACMRYYEAKHPNDDKQEKVGKSPNGYFMSSIKHFGLDKKAAGSNANNNINTNIPNTNTKTGNKINIAYEDSNNVEKPSEENMKMDII